MTAGTYHVLFLCTGNSARSILAEALLNRWGGGSFRGHSAGSQPRGAVHPLALKALAEAGVPTVGLASKSWKVYGRADAPEMDFIITVCDRAARETCPIWPGNPLTATWAMPDPAEVEGDAETQLNAFRETFRVLEMRVQMLAAQRFWGADRSRIEQVLDGIGAYFPAAVTTR